MDYSKPTFICELLTGKAFVMCNIREWVNTSTIRLDKMNGSLRLICQKVIPVKFSCRWIQICLLYLNYVNVFPHSFWKWCSYKLHCMIFQELVSIDCKQAAQMVISTMPKNLGVVANKMKSNPKILFGFLKGVMSYRWVLSIGVGTFSGELLPLFYESTGTSNLIHLSVCHRVHVNPEWAEGSQCPEIAQIFFIPSNSSWYSVWSIILGNICTCMYKTIHILFEKFQKLPLNCWFA